MDDGVIILVLSLVVLFIIFIFKNTGKGETQKKEITYQQTDTQTQKTLGSGIIFININYEEKTLQIKTIEDMKNIFKLNFDELKHCYVDFNLIANKCEFLAVVINDDTRVTFKNIRNDIITSQKFLLYYKAARLLCDEISKIQKETCLEDIKATGLNITQKSDCSENLFYVCEEDKKVIIRESYHNNCIIVNFSEIINYNVIDNDVIVSDNSNAVTGGILFGTVGAVAAGQTQRNLCSSLKLMIFLSTKEKSLITLDFLPNTILGIEKSSQKYKEKQQGLYEIVSAIERIKISNNEINKN